MGCSLRIVACAIGIAAAMLAGASAQEERLKPGFTDEPTALLAEAERVMNVTPKRALDLTAQILDFSDAPFSPEFLAKLHYVRARASTNAGDHKDAVSESALALELLNGAEPELRADILTTMSISLGRSRETRRAFELQQQALNIRRELGDVAGEAMSLSALAELYLDIGLRDKGIASFEAAVERARAAHQPEVLAIILNNYAYFVQLHHDYQRARTLLDEALTLNFDSPRLKAFLSLNAADAAYFLGQPDKAGQLLKAAAPVAEALQQPILMAGMNLGEARLARDRGDLEGARLFAERALTYARVIDNQRELGDITRLLADVNEELGNHQAAYGYLRGHAAYLAADAASASARSASLFEAETQLAARDQEMELLRRDSRITRLAVARAVILRNAAILSALLLAAGLIAVALLLREKARAKASIELKNRELTAAYEQLEAANRNKSNFLSVMSHELKTPLNAIIGFSDILGKSGAVSAASTAEFAKIINIQGRNLLRMVTEILLFTSATEQELALDETVEALGDMLAHAIEITGEIHPDAFHRIDLAPIDASIAISCDIDQLANCVARILDNALKFSPVESRVSLIAVKNAGGDLEIAVSDDGPGIGDAEIPRMLDILTQGDQSLARNKPGAGLGLPIANRIADAHGGRIALSRSPSGGATVAIILPGSRLVLPADRAAA